MNGRTFKGNPGQGWTDITDQVQADNAAQALKDSQAKIDAANAADKAANDARFAQDKTDVTDFNTKFSTAVPGIINDTSDKYQLGDLLGQSNALNTRVKNLQGNLTNEGAGGYANANQVDAAINSRYLPAAQTAVSNLQTGTQLAQNEENTLLTPYTTEATLLNDRLAREATGYTTEQQNELDSLVSQMNAGVSLSQTQIQQATALATAEKEYQNNLDLQNLKNSATTSDSNRYITIGDGSQLYDTQTGQIVASNVKDFKSGTGTGETFS